MQIIKQITKRHGCQKMCSWHQTVAKIHYAYMCCTDRYLIQWRKFNDTRYWTNSKVSTLYKPSYKSHLWGMCTTSRPQVDDWRQYVSGSNVGLVTDCDTYKSASPNLPTWQNENHYSIRRTNCDTLVFISEKLWHKRTKRHAKTKLV
jgi:hypothetical protein